MRTLLNTDIVELNYSSPEEIDKEVKVGNIILPFGSGKSGLTKTVTCKIKNLNTSVSKNLHIYIGDEILVDRYAIIQIRTGERFNAYIKTNSILMVKKQMPISASGRSIQDRIVDYLESAPKKCFFSVYNETVRQENIAIAGKYSKLINKIVNAWTFRENKDETMEEFRRRARLITLDS